MEAHAVPQEIMSVEFKLFGNFLSLREFIFIAVGLALAYFFYFLMNSGIIPGIIAIPLILVFGLGGILIGLVPYQDQGLDKWITNYFLAIRQPTQRVWKKENFNPQQFQPQRAVIRKTHMSAGPTKTSRTAQPAHSVQSTAADQKEEAQIKTIDAAFQQVESGKSATTTAQTNQPQPPTPPPTQPVAPQQPAQPTPSPANSPTQLTQPTPPQQPANRPTAQPTQSQPNQKSPTAQPTPQSPPTQQSSTATSPTPPERPAVSAPLSENLNITDENIKDYATTIPGVEENKNTINIVIKDASGQILPGVVCVVKNPKGEPVRAGISNNLGQVINNVSLESSTYKILLTKKGYVFPEITRTLTGKKYPPIEIKSF